MKTFKEYLAETSSWKDKKGVDKKKPWSQQVRDSVERERKRLEKIKNTKGYDAYLKAIKESEKVDLEEGHAEMTNAMNNIPAEKRPAARKSYKHMRNVKKMPHAAAVTYMLNLHKKETELDEDWKKVAMGAAIAATVVAGGARGIQNNREVEKLEQQHSVLVQKNPKKAEQLRHHLDQAKAVKGNTKLNGQFDHHIQQAKSIVEEIELQEMSKETIGAYLKKRVPQIANAAAEEGLEAGTYHKHEKTVIGRNPETGEPIYAKSHKKFKVDKMIKGVTRAAERLAK